MPLEDIAEKARAEGDRAEAENPDEEEAAEQEETPFQAPEGVPTEAPPPEPPTPGVAPEQAAELEKATAAYHKKVNKIYGGESPPPCPACYGLGFDLTGGAAPLEFRRHERFSECEGCGGLGEVATGSKVPEARELSCPDCQGRGYIDRLANAPVPVATIQGAPPELVPAGVTPPWMGNATVPTAS